MVVSFQLESFAKVFIQVTLEGNIVHGVIVRGICTLPIYIPSVMYAYNLTYSVRACLHVAIQTSLLPLLLPTHARLPGLVLPARSSCINPVPGLCIVS